MKKRSFINVLSQAFFSLVILHSLTTISYAQTYKWKADDGTVRYSDVLPAEETDKKKTVLDSNGIRIKEIERTKTAKELAIVREKRRKKIAQNKLEDKKRKEEQHLIKSYRSEKDLVRAQNAKIKSIQQSIELNQDSISLHQSNIEKLRHKAAEYERARRRVPSRIHTNIRSIRDTIKTTQESISNKRRQQSKIKVEYEELLARYRKLTQ